MKVFIFKIVVFFALLAASALVLFSILCHEITKKEYYQVPSKVHSLVLGHSHAACAFNDTILEGFYNLAQNTEGYPYSYYKAKKLLEANDHIERIFIEYTNNQISPWALERIYGSYLDINMSRMLPVLDKRFVIKTCLQSKDASKILRSFHKTLINNLRFMVGSPTNYVEEFWHDHKTPDHVYDKEPDSVLPFDEYKFKDIYSIQQENISFLLKIKELCAEYDVELILVRSPLPQHVEFENEKVFLDIKQRYFAEVPFLDFKKMSAMELELFADDQHLNTNGRNEFSRYFRDNMDLYLNGFEPN